jgi:endonuclease G, mitochondrial
MELSKQTIDSLRGEARDAGVLDASGKVKPVAAPVVDPLERCIPGTMSAETATRIETASETGFSLTRRDFERMMGLNDLVDEFFLARALVAARPVMRIALRASSGREMGYATGVLVSPSLLLTNHHVFPFIDDTFNAVVDAHYVNDIFGKPDRSYRFKVRSDLYYEKNEELDWSLVAIDAKSEDGEAELSQFGYHRLIPTTGKIKEGEFITLIQHPAGQRRQFSIRENQFVKYHKQFLWYKSDTAPGSSGSPAFNDGFQMVGLHHAGVPEQDGEMFVLSDGRRVASLTGFSEDMIKWEANAGVRVSQICESFEAQLPKKHALTEELFAAMQSGDVMSNPGNEVVLPQTGTGRAGSDAAVGRPEVIDGGLSIPLRVNVRLSLDGLGQVTAPIAASRKTADALPSPEDAAFIEKIPIIDRDYSSRSGKAFNTKFLSVEIPLPTVEDQSLLSFMDNGEFVIPYHNFSVVLNKKRRMAFFTAANVDSSDEARRPEPDRIYTRQALAGFDKEAVETWITDSRIPAMHQLPDRFYTKDRKAFDKGHIVQRDCVCWGASYAEVQRANGDTYHVTNCSPQTMSFNQSARGVDNWGDLENEIMKQAQTEKLSVLSGPIFTNDDPDFHGLDDFGAVVIPVPRKYWKIVVAETNGALQSFAFVLEQDLTNVKFEFFVPDAWKKNKIRILDLQELIKPVKLPQVVVAADQF